MKRRTFLGAVLVALVAPLRLPLWSNAAPIPALPPAPPLPVTLITTGSTYWDGHVISASQLNQTFATLNEALAHAVPGRGDRILLAPGVYRESVTLPSGAVMMSG